PEVNVGDLPVVAGRIPEGLSGVYMRNGPNPLFKPLSYTYPLDGDGMIHAVYLDNGRARYRNRFVDTRGLRAERRAGRALYGGVMQPVPVDPALIGSDGEPGPFKNGACINVIRHGGHLLALYEAAAGYEMTMELETIGEWRAGTDTPLELGAHNRRHPRTGAMFALTYAIDQPIVRFHQIDPSGNLVSTFPLSIAAPTIIHDFVLTERHIVVLACPVVFDIEAAQRGQSLIQWRPELGTRIGVVGLDGGSVLWLDADPFFVFHFANGFESGGRIVIDYVRHERLVLGSGYQGGLLPPMLHRMTIDLAGRRITDDRIADMMVEFPRANDTREATRTRFVYSPALTDTLGQSDPASATFNAIAKANAETGDVVLHDFGNKLVGEAVFVPRAPWSAESAAEDDGYLAVFVFDPANGTSDFVLLDAAHVDQEPVAMVRLPQRVPQGLHGNWIAGG
ncbi:MAG: carotenoid oxygenase family protein, partial [Geminicoccaceae bacterium]